MTPDAFRNIIEEILEEEQSKTEISEGKRKAGETWKTDSGKWASINKAHPTYTRYFADEPAARTYATKKIAPSKKSDDAPVSKMSTDSKGRALALKKKPNRFASKSTAKKDTSGDEESSLIKKFQRDMQNSEPDTDSDSTKKSSHKFGGGGGFSGGGSSGKF